MSHGEEEIETIGQVQDNMILKKGDFKRTK